MKRAITEQAVKLKISNLNYFYRDSPFSAQQAKEFVCCFYSAWVYKTCFFNKYNWTIYNNTRMHVVAEANKEKKKWYKKMKDITILELKMKMVKNNKEYESRRDNDS